MQAVMYFKRGRDQNYMMRSEKRPGYPHRPPRPPKKSVWYQVLTIVLLIVFCPAGLILLWRKRLTWPGATKLAATLLSLITMFLVLGALLWYPFRNERVRGVQQHISAAVNRAASVFENLGENWTAVIDYHEEIGAAAGNHALGRFLEAIASPTPRPTQVPPLTLTPTDGSRETIVSLFNQPTPSPVPTATPTPEPTPEPTPTPEPEPAATDEAAPSANVLDRPTPSSGLSLAPGASDTPVPLVTPTPTPTATPTPSPTPTPTPEPTINPALIPRLQDAGETLVWHTSDGKWYHRASVCGSMSNARQHTLKSAVANGKTACPYCHPMEEKWARSGSVVYASTDGFWHVRAECESMTEEWTVLSLDDARADQALSPCDACGAMYYVDGIPAALSLPADASAAETPVPGTTPAGSAAPEGDGLSLSEVVNGDTLVYYNDRTSYYHTRSTCASSATLTFVPHKLMDALLEGKHACPFCGAPEPTGSN